MLEILTYLLTLISLMYGVYSIYAGFLKLKTEVRSDTIMITIFAGVIGIGGAYLLYKLPENSKEWKIEETIRVNKLKESCIIRGGKITENHGGFFAPEWQCEGIAK